MGSDILKTWLVEEVGLSLQNVEKVRALWPVSKGRPGSQASLHAQDFANGCLFGQLLHHYGMQPDFDKFVDTRHPDAMVNNYTRLQVRAKGSRSEDRGSEHRGSRFLPNMQSSLLKLGVKFDTRTANSLMREEAGVALRLLYSLKQNLGQVNKDVQVRPCAVHGIAYVWGSWFGATSALTQPRHFKFSNLAEIPEFRKVGQRAWCVSPCDPNASGRSTIQHEEGEDSQQCSAVGEARGQSV